MLKDHTRLPLGEYFAILPGKTRSFSKSLF
jgi:hypothetical protein